MKLKKFKFRIKKAYGIMALTIGTLGLLGTSYAAWTDTDVITAVMSVFRFQITPDEFEVNFGTNFGVCTPGHHIVKQPISLSSTANQNVIIEQIELVEAFAVGTQGLIDIKNNIPQKDEACYKNNCKLSAFEGFVQGVKIIGGNGELKPGESKLITVQLPISSHVRQLMDIAQGDKSREVKLELNFDIKGRIGSEQITSRICLKVTMKQGATLLNITTPSTIQVTLPEIWGPDIPVILPEITTSSSLVINHE